MTTTRLTRSMLDRVFGGVCGGIGKYLGLSAWWVRIAFIALTLAMPGFGVLLYVLIWFIIPGQTLDDMPPLNPSADQPHELRYARPETVLLLGAGAIGAGIVVLAENTGAFQGLRGDMIVPTMLLLIGIVLFIKQLGGRA